MRLYALVTTLILSVLLAACGSSSEASENTAPQTAPQSVSQPAPTKVPATVQPAGGISYDCDGVAFLEYPDDWSVDGFDMYPSNSTPSLVSVRCGYVIGNVFDECDTPDLMVWTVCYELNNLMADSTVENHNVTGYAQLANSEGLMLTYRRNGRDRVSQVLDVYFWAEKPDGTRVPGFITLKTAPELHEKYLPVFHDMLATLQIR